jgi:hypothetical protein
MAAGIVVRPHPAAANAVDDAISQASGAFHRGVRHVWLGQRFDVDALTLAAVIATAVPGIGVGTAVVPINPRHPCWSPPRHGPPRPPRTAISASVSGSAETSWNSVLLASLPAKRWPAFASTSPYCG